jgi:hypothetical protein
MGNPSWRTKIGMQRLTQQGSANCICTDAQYAQSGEHPCHGSPLHNESFLNIPRYT